MNAAGCPICGNPTELNEENTQWTCYNCGLTGTLNTLKRN